MITTMLRILLTRSFRPLELTSNLGAEELPDAGEHSFGLYVHIPFCRELCSFCPYQKQPFHQDTAARYTAALIQEIHRTGARMAGPSTAPLPVTSVYFGGGTPALLLEQLEAILNALRAYYVIDGEMGIELHPLDVTGKTLGRLRELGFTMVSLGIQSFQARCLRVLGRTQKDGRECVRLAREAGFRTVDVDLIFAMEGQTEEELRSDFVTAFATGATQVSTYPFIEFSYASGSGKPLRQSEKRKLLRCIEQAGSELGCERTSVWTFGMSETPKYSSITRDAYVGFGPSAATLTRQSFRVNTFSVEDYIRKASAGESAAAVAMAFSERTRALYWLFWNAYTLELNRKAFYELFRKELDLYFKWELRLAQLFGLLRKCPGGYKLTGAGAYLYHLLEQKYTNQYIDKTWRAAKEQAWPERIELY